jgi:hypothetical protein
MVYLRFTIRLPEDKFGVFPDSSRCPLCGVDIVAKKWCRPTLDAGTIVKLEE